MIGDGGIKNGQIVISLNAKTEEAYALFIRQLIERLFHLQPSIYQDIKNGTISVAVASVELVKLLTSLGLPIGDKIRSGITIPTWILENVAWKKAVLRGLFDTDGSLYIDTHTINGKRYRNLSLAFTSYSLPLLNSVTMLLRELKFSPTITTLYRINLRRENQIVQFFESIGSHNAYTLLKYQDFFRSLN